MGVNKIDNDQHESQMNVDHEQIYGSQQIGRHNLEGSSPLSTDEIYGVDVNPSFIQNNDSDQQFMDQDKEGLYVNDFSREDDSHQYGQNTSLGKLNDIEKAKSVSSVEGDDQDILGETENKQRNEQQINARETNKDKSQSC